MASRWALTLTVAGSFTLSLLTGHTRNVRQMMRAAGLADAHE